MFRNENQGNIPRKSHGNKRLSILPDDLRSFISHELRAPLTCVDGALRLMACSELQLSAFQQTELIAVARNNSQRLTELVDKLLDEQKWSQLNLSAASPFRRRSTGITSNAQGRPVEASVLRVLMVDDDYDYFRFVRQVLEQSHNPRFEMEHIDSVASLDMDLSLPCIDAILLDLTLPDSQGSDTVTTVRGRFPRVPIIVLTGTNNEEVGLQMVADGADDYLVKHHLSNELLVRCIKYAVTRKTFEESTMRLAAISDFTNALAHDLEVPLTGARNVLEVLAKQSLGPLNDAQQEIVSILRASTETQLALLEKLLEAYRFDLMSPEIPSGAVNLQSVVNKALSDLCKNDGDQERSRFVVRSPSDPPLVQGNADALIRLFFNLLENALVHGDPHSPVQIGWQSSPATISVEIHNWGNPIPKEVMNSTFERLWHGIPGKTYVAKSGVGLYLAQRIVSLHGGRILCKSNAKEGTTVTVQLPPVAVRA